MAKKSNKKQKQRKSKKWEKQKKQQDAVMQDPLSTDLVIPLMGPTGVGKSSFINKYFGQNNLAQVGENLTSCTRDLAWYTLKLADGRRLVLVDTPGFDDTFIDDSEILRRIAVWLAASYAEEMCLAGVLYLHDIGQKRMFGSTRMNLDMFEKLVGLNRKGEFPTIALVTTQWDLVKTEIGIEREKELRESFWKGAIGRGATVYRADSPESYGSIINDILRKNGPVRKDTAMLIQEELVEQERILPLTEAGKTLRYGLDELLKHQTEMTKNADNEEKKKELKEKKEATQKQRDAVSASMAQRFSGWARTLLRP